MHEIPNLDWSRFRESAEYAQLLARQLGNDRFWLGEALAAAAKDTEAIFDAGLWRIQLATGDPTVELWVTEVGHRWEGPSPEHRAFAVLRGAIHHTWLEGGAPRFVAVDCPPVTFSVRKGLDHAMAFVPETVALVVRFSPRSESLPRLSAAQPVDHILRLVLAYVPGKTFLSQGTR